METTLGLKQEEFINNVVLPYHQGLNQNKSHYIIYNLDGTIRNISDVTLKLLGYTDIQQVKGKTLAQIYTFADSCAAICKELDLIHQKVIYKKITEDYLCVSEFSLGLKAYLMQHSPILYSDGEAIGSIVLFGETSKAMSEGNNGLLSDRQMETVFLLSLGVSQKGVAAILKITRGTIAKNMESISTKLNIMGASQRNIIDKIAEMGCCGKLPLGIIKPGVVPISKLYHNNQILSLFKK